MAFFFKNKGEMPDLKSAPPGGDPLIRTAATPFVRGASLKGRYPDGSQTPMLGLCRLLGIGAGQAA